VKADSQILIHDIRPPAGWHALASGPYSCSVFDDLNDRCRGKQILRQAPGAAKKIAAMANLRRSRFLQKQQARFTLSFPRARGSRRDYYRGASLMFALRPVPDIGPELD
jgi:hypothetical protein